MNLNHDDNNNYNDTVVVEDNEDEYTRQNILIQLNETVEMNDSPDSRRI